jgi:HAD superfamily hydrolase (TIGR01490 family)
VTDTGAPRPRAVAVFDFDGTITRRDTLKPYLARVVGTPRLAAAFARESLAVAAWAAGRQDIDAVKRRIVRRVLAGVPVEAARRAALVHAEAIARGLRREALARLRWHRDEGHRLVLASAGLDLYLEPVAARLGFDDLLCSRLAVRDGRFTGELDGADCTGAEKLRRLEALLGGLAGVELHAYGDSPGDAALLAAATHAHWRPFRRSA